MRTFARSMALAACLGWACLGWGVDGALAQPAPTKAKAVRCHDAKGKIVKCTAAGAIPATTPAAPAAVAKPTPPTPAAAPAPAKPSLLQSLMAKKSGAGSAPAAANGPAPGPRPASVPAGPTPAKAHKSSKAASGGGKSSASMTTAEGATAKCKDGTYWKSATHAGSCSHHGGVAAFL